MVRSEPLANQDHDDSSRFGGRLAKETAAFECEARNPNKIELGLYVHSTKSQVVAAQGDMPIEGYVVIRDDRNEYRHHQHRHGYGCSGDEGIP